MMEEPGGLNLTWDLPKSSKQGFLPSLNVSDTDSYNNSVSHPFPKAGRYSTETAENEPFSYSVQTGIDKTLHFCIQDLFFLTLYLSASSNTTYSTAVNFKSISIMT